MAVFYSPDILRAARALTDLTAADFAAKAKVSRTALRNAETGGMSITLETIERIQRAYEELGVEFTLPGPSFGAGVRWKSRAKQ
ncbi:MAG: helix-turn-helix transcriptional regulator [Pseudorhizobium pelagicum]|uniref:helix-turn-helix transcriptional regulator n=1 Tax=Pseudorhizobium pelagicum TaxID=1509405 RepID=UPI003460818D